MFGVVPQIQKIMKKKRKLTGSKIRKTNDRSKLTSSGFGEENCAAKTKLEGTISLLLSTFLLEDNNSSFLSKKKKQKRKTRFI